MVCFGFVGFDDYKKKCKYHQTYSLKYTKKRKKERNNNSKLTFLDFHKITETVAAYKERNQTKNVGFGKLLTVIYTEIQGDRLQNHLCVSLKD